MSPRCAVRAIVAAGSICGVLDGICAIIVGALFHVTPIRDFQGIAVGLLGRSSYSGGLATAFLGVALHFLVAFGAAATYYGASRLMPVLRERALVWGVLYGIAVDLFMRFVVTPLSAIGWHRPAFLPFAAILVVHIVVVGPSISLTVRRYSR